MNLLHLNLKGEYFDQIAKGEKFEEYRLYSPYWRKRLLARDYKFVVLRRGYPKRDDLSKVMVREIAGIVIKIIKHPHFGKKPVTVFAIQLGELYDYGSY